MLKDLLQKTIAGWNAGLVPFSLCALMQTDLPTKFRSPRREELREIHTAVLFEIQMKLGILQKFGVVRNSVASNELVYMIRFFRFSPRLPFLVSV